MSRHPELLAPAGSMEALHAAIRCGADAVYLGGARFSARAHADNFDAAALGEAAALCHESKVRMYPAINTLLFDGEYSELDKLLAEIAEIGADGVIVQDFGVAAYIRKRVPTLRLHASTQMTIHSPAGIRFAADAGFCRVVAARELSRSQIAELCREGAKCGVEIEVFVHGAHCMSVSGQCWMSAAMGGRSANRGCCAQPCRLPYAADESGRAEYALSLKDQSLVKHLPELREIGVASLKIEGRMKRPEYVAAAVSACRAVLDGKQADLESLRAVFSRDGFTNAYYTGTRREMFGTRRKEDVTAAQDVLDSLRELYRKPRKCAVIDAHFTLHSDQPAKLTVSDQEGCHVCVSGAVPEPAKTRSADLDLLRKQFDKLGDTVYTAGCVNADIMPGLMLSASALNAMRRDAVAALKSERIRVFSPPHVLHRQPSRPVGHSFAAETRFRLQIRSLSQLSELGQNAARLDALLIPLHLIPSYASGPMPVSPARCQIVPPRFVCAEPDVTERLQQAKQLGFSHLLCGHAADVKLGSELGMTLHGGLGLHVTNSWAASALAEKGLADLLQSPELIGNGSLAAAVPVGVYAYGRLPLMLTRNCPIQALVGCAACRHVLTDRKGAQIYTDCTRYQERPDYAELFNPAVVWLPDRMTQLSKAGYILLSVTDETAHRTADVVRAYMDGMSIPPPVVFTRGLRLSDA